MAGSSGAGSASHEWDIRKWGVSDSVSDFSRLYFTKEEARSLTTKITAVNHTVDYIKAGLAGLALGFTVLKADFTLFKVDEKGISLLGVNRYTFPWAKEGEKWWRRFASQKEVDKYDKKLADAEQKDKDFKKYVADNYYKKSRAGGLNRRINQAQNSADRAHSEIRALKTRLRTAGQAANTPSSGDKRAEFNRMRNSVQELSKALAGI